MYVALVKGQLRVVANVAMNLKFPQKARKFSDYLRKF